jgi:hypothetical protein
VTAWGAIASYCKLQLKNYRQGDCKLQLKNYRQAAAGRTGFRLRAFRGGGWVEKMAIWLTRTGRINYVGF